MAGNDGKQSVGDLTSIAVLISAFVGVLGVLALTGTVGRVQRNEPDTIAGAFFLMLLAGTLWLIASQVRRGRIAIRIVACVPALVGFGLGLNAAVSTADDEPRPQIRASLSDDARKLTAKISASNMETEDRLAIFVDALTRKPNDPENYTTDPVYRAYEGPDADDNVKITVSMFLPIGRYTDVGIKAFTDRTSLACDDQLAKDAAVKRSAPSQGKPGSGTGCVTMAIIPKKPRSNSSNPEST